MFYEGTEKRLEIIIKGLNLLQFPESFWIELLHQADTLILSKIENSYLTAYLLSESSLFIWHNKILLITCGNTHLVKAAQYFQREIPKNKIISLLFHRHQAIQPNLQKSNFDQDTLLLSTDQQGVTQHWRGEYQGDLFYFAHQEQPADYKQILMCHHLTGELAQKTQSGLVSTAMMEMHLAINRFFENLIIDHFTFDPKGYSLNAICANDYLTIHLTPEKLSSYLSLETSFNNASSKALIAHILRLFQPQQSHLMCFNSTQQGRLEINLSNPLKSP